MNHHAFLLIGNPEWAKSCIPKSDTQADIDVLYKEFDRLGIDDVRTLVYESSRGPVVHTHRVFILFCKALTREAQNALLKLFEDPNDTARFYLIVPSESSLIATLRSRLFVLGIEKNQSVNHEKAQNFLSESYAERLSYIVENSKRDDDAWVWELLNALEQYYELKKDTLALNEIVYVRSHIRAQGASKKMLLEHLALSLSTMR